MRGSFLFLATALLLFVFLSGCGGSNPPGEKPQAPASGLTTTPSELAHFTSGQIGFVEFSSTISGGTPPYSCSLSKDSTLPSGLELGSDCTIFGSHTLAPGTASKISPPFTVQVTDSSQPARGTTLKLSVTIDAEKPALSFVIGHCTVGQQCNAQVAKATGGTEPYTFSSGTYAPGAGGAPPQGMLVGIDGILTGTPSEQGAFRIGVCVKDAVGLSDCGETEVIVEAAPKKEPCYFENIEEQQYAGQPVCCQSHSWCNGPNNCCEENGCLCYPQ
ncbi:MAG: putative Ig domain-containing protein [Candidatus Micrarchaeia archaeon]